MRVAFVFALIPAVAAAAAPKPMPAWVGTFAPHEPVSPCADCKTQRIVPRAGQVRVLTPGGGAAPAAGDVVLVVNPMLGVVAHGKLDGGRVDVAWFNYDRRDSDDGVLVLPGDAVPRLITPTPLEVVAIKQALLRDEVLSGVKRALIGLEVGAIDVDGDGKADFAVTYGCNAWGDGSCQSRGQFFLARRGAKWVEID